MCLEYWAVMWVHHWAFTVLTVALFIQYHHYTLCNLPWAFLPAHWKFWYSITIAIFIYVYIYIFGKKKPQTSSWELNPGPFWIHTSALYLSITPTIILWYLCIIGHFFIYHFVGVSLSGSHTSELNGGFFMYVRSTPTLTLFCALCQVLLLA